MATDAESPMVWGTQTRVCVILGCNPRTATKLADERKIGTRRIAGRTEYWIPDVLALAVDSITPAKR
jgi:hypothetical protein